MRDKAGGHEQLAREIARACLSMGFALAGFTKARVSDFEESMRDWLAGGQHGTMEWMRETVEVRLDIEKFLNGARSVIVVADQYPLGKQGMADGERYGWGKIAAYARGRDYHKVMSARLHRLADRLREVVPGESFRVFVDALPVMEREHAARAGLGWIGKNTMLIHPELGSGLLLGGIATTVELAGMDDVGEMPDHCGTCTRCIDACPTKAIAEVTIEGKRAVNASACISYLTIEHEGMIEEHYHEEIGDWLLGCDVCQEVCPFNRDWVTSRLDGHGGAIGRVNPAYSSATVRISGVWEAKEILSWSAEDRARLLGSSAVKRATLEMLKRNALIVLGNSAKTRFSEEIGRLIARVAEDKNEAEVVRETARQVLRRIGC